MGIHEVVDGCSASSKVKVTITDSVSIEQEVKEGRYKYFDQTPLSEVFAEHCAHKTARLNFVRDGSWSAVIDHHFNPNLLAWVNEVAKKEGLLVTEEDHKSSAWPPSRGIANVID